MAASCFTRLAHALRLGAATLSLSLVAFAATENFQWNGTLANGERLEVRDINGSVDVSPSSGNRVEITAVKKSTKSSLDDVQIKVENEAGGIVVCTLYRQKDNSFPAGCRDNRKGRTKNNIDVSVSYTVRMPAAANLKASTVNGNVNIRGLSGNVVAQTVNGDVELETNGHAEANTVNGTVRARVGNLDRDSNFRTVNGRIEVAVRNQVNADVSMSTVNGNLSTDFPITVQGKVGKRNLQGRIGSGGPALKMSTVNGSIRLEKAS